jgi:hypothetical protein
MNKDTVYIDVNDEITSVIEKVQSSESKIVALVLPKRAAVFQSIVNMKLLKRSAKQAKKNVVLITNETGLLPLAGAVGMHVAKNLQSKPYIPKPPAGGAVPLAAAADYPDDLPDATAPVGELADTPAADGDDTIEIEDNAENEDEPVEVPDKPAKEKKMKSLKVPNFNRFRLLLGAGGLLLIGLVVFLFMANTVLPKASVSVKTDTNTIEVTPTPTISTAAQSFDAANGIIPAKTVENKKTDSQKVAATGQKDNGTKATGTVDMSAGACSGDQPGDVPAGTGVSANSLTYITQNTASFSPTLKGGKCTWTANGIKVAAQSNGDKYNTGSATFTVAGRSDVSATTDGIDGGTSKIVKVVAQGDIDGAKQQLSAKAGQTATDELKTKLKAQGLFGIEDTLVAGDPQVTTDNKVGDEADSVTVTTTTTYTMWGINKNDIISVVTKAAEGQIDKSKQKILKTGVDDASIKVQSKKSATDQVLSVQSKVVAGPELKPDEIKSQIAGKKSGEIKSLLESRPGVKEVDVKFSPFWVNKTPKNVKKITLTLDTPQSDDAAN